ncbi:MAG: SurA N-terminal domain-containing protein [Spiribacter sp.]|nr:SurA N-terminal domain-containing protein [Spiribacter sp.]
MLLAIRDRTRGWIAYLIVALLVVPFALFGLYNYVGNGGGERTVATVDGEEITSTQLDEAFQARQSELREVLGDRFDSRLFDSDQIRREALDQLIDRQLLLNHAEATGIQVSDADVATYIRSREFFESDGAFSVDRYRDVLQQNRLTPDRYEAQVRQDLTTNLLRRVVESSAYTSDWELDRLIALQQQRREIGWVSVDADAYQDAVELTENELEAWYADNAERFRRPARVKLRYLSLDPEALAEEMTVSEAEIQAAYDERLASLEASGERTVRHILAQVTRDADDTEVAEAREAIESARARIEGGESFEAVAEAVSDDTGSARRGGDLGRVARDDLAPAFAEAAWSLDPQELSDPVRTDFGFHLIEVTNAPGSDQPSLAALEDELRQEVALDKAERAVFERGNQLETLAFENPDTLAPAAEALGVDVSQSDWIPQGGTESGIGSEPAVLDAAFSDALLEDRENSDLIELNDETYVVLRVDQYEDERVPPLSDVRDEAREAFRNERALTLAKAQAESLAGDLRSGSDPVSAANGVRGAEGHAPRLASRNNRDLPGGVRERAFRLYLGDSNERAVGVASASGGWAAVLLTDIEAGDPDAADAEQREQLRSTINDLDSRDGFRSVLAALRADADVEIREDSL